MDGIDCVGVMFYSLLEAGWTPRDPRFLEWTDYDRRAGDDHILSWGRTEALRELSALDECELGDIIVIRYEGDEFAQHVGVLTRKRADGVMVWVHASTEEERVVEHRISPQWKKRFVAGFRFMEEVTHGQST